MRRRAGPGRAMLATLQLARIPSLVMLQLRFGLQMYLPAPRSHTPTFRGWPSTQQPLMNFPTLPPLPTCAHSLQFGVVYQAFLSLLAVLPESSVCSYCLKTLSTGPGLLGPTGASLGDGPWVTILSVPASYFYFGPL